MSNELMALEVVNGKPMATSIQVATYFEKEHKNVIRDIRETFSKCSPDFTQLNCELSEYVDSTGRTLPMYMLSKDGLMMVAMGYTTPKAMEVKERYIAAFNAMEETLKNMQALPDFTNPVIAARAWADAMEAKQLATVEAQQKTLALEASEKTVQNLIHTPKTYTASELGKEFGYPSAIVFNKLLEDMEIQYKRNGTWLPHAKFADKGWFSIKQTETSAGLVIYNTRFTGKGRKEIGELLNKYSDVEE